VKVKENEGFQYEDADASFFLMTKKALESFKPFFILKGYRVTVEKHTAGEIISEATVKLIFVAKKSIQLQKATAL
jgi:2-isopropylmalate synthase